ncbi:hypothetical protein PQ077_02090 [Litorivicinus sp.]|nr:hypothetical protein [Litorivicinus sp.]
MAKKIKKIEPLTPSILEALTGQIPADFQRYQIESFERMFELWCELKPTSWFDFAVRLMLKYDPAFKSDGRRGRPKKWTDFRLMILAGELYRLRTHSGFAADGEAYDQLAIMEPWVRLIDKKNDRDTLGDTPADALRVALNEAGDHIKQAGKDAYLYHYESGTLNEWKKYLQKLILD